MKAKNNSRLGVRLAAIGAVTGLVAAMALGTSQFLGAKGPEVAPQLAGYIAFTLIYLSPYIIALIASRIRDSGTRGGLLVAVGLLSLAASFSPLALVTVIFLPATVLILFAAARSLSAADRLLATAIPSMVVGLFIAAIVGASYFALFGVFDPESQCWLLSQGPDGQFRWESSEGSSSGPLSYGMRFFCMDIITNAEAALSVVILAIAFLGMLMLSKWLRTSRTA